MSDVAPEGVQFHCDSTTGNVFCPATPHRGVVLFVPDRLAAVRFMNPEYRPLRMMTTLHYCEVHRVELDQKKLAADLLSQNVKVDFERMAKAKRAPDFKCDFEKAFLQFMLVTTPEYRRFLAGMGFAGVMGAAALTPQQQRMLRGEIGTMKVAG